MEYLVNYHKINCSPAPHFDIDKEMILQKTILSLIENHHIQSAHDVSDGGLYVNLVESGIVRGLGFDIFTNHDFRQDAYLFGESQSRVVVTVNPENKQKFEKFLKDKIEFTLLGEVTDGKIIIDDLDFGNINAVKEDYLSAIENVLES